MAIHPTAIVDRRAEVDPACEIGPFTLVDGPVRLGPRVRLVSHVSVVGNVSVGADAVLFPGVHVGHEPQDVSYRGQASAVRIGERSVLREGCVVHRGSQEGAETVVGPDCFLMSNVHVAHDCRVAEHVILATGAVLGGHVHVGERAFISGNCVVHQHVRVGRLVMMRGLARASLDLPPFCIADETSVVRGVNRIGLRRAGMDATAIRAVARAVRMLFVRRGLLRDALAAVEEALGEVPEVAELLAFVRGSARGVARGPRGRGAGGVDA